MKSVAVLEKELQILRKQCQQQEMELRGWRDSNYADRRTPLARSDAVLLALADGSRWIVPREIYNEFEVLRLEAAARKKKR